VEGVVFVVGGEVEMLSDGGGAATAEAGKVGQRQAGLAVASGEELAPGAGDRALAAWGTAAAAPAKGSKVNNVI
jgi:hypothetical protein